MIERNEYDSYIYSVATYLMFENIAQRFGSVIIDNRNSISYSSEHSHFKWVIGQSYK